MDIESWYFIASFSSLNEGQPYIREIWRKVPRENFNTYLEKLELHTPQQKYVDIFYITEDKVYQHNRDIYDTLNTETQLETKY